MPIKSEFFSRCPCHVVVSTQCRGGIRYKLHYAIFGNVCVRKDRETAHTHTHENSVIFHFNVLHNNKRGRRRRRQRCGVVQGRCLITDLHSDPNESNDRLGRFEPSPRINRRRVSDDRTCKLLRDDDYGAFPCNSSPVSRRRSFRHPRVAMHMTQYALHRRT